MSLSVATSLENGIAKLLVEDEVDVSNASVLRDAIDAVLADKPDRVEVDVSNMPYIDSTGIGVLVGASRRASEAGIGFAVLRPQRNVARVLQMLGVEKELGNNA